MNEIIVINKRPMEFSITYPRTLSNGTVCPQYKIPPAKNGNIIEWKLPFEVYDWLKNSTTTFLEGYLLVKQTEENEQQIEDIKENNDLMNKAILSEKELMDIVSTGNQNVFKKKLNELIENLDDEVQINAVKDYVWSIYTENGIDSTAKIKVLCDWVGRDYDKVKDLFDRENIKLK